MPSMLLLPFLALGCEGTQNGDEAWRGDGDQSRSGRMRSGTVVQGKPSPNSPKNIQKNLVQLLVIPLSYEAWCTLALQLRTLPPAAARTPTHAN